MRPVIALVSVLAACGDGGGSGNDLGGSGNDLGGAEDMTLVSPCGSTGPFGTFTMVHGGQSGVTACGHTFTSFSGATVTIDHDGGSGALLTVTGTGMIGDTTNCAAMVDGCHVTASGCASGSMSYINYDLMIYTHQLSGTAMPNIPGAGGGCGFTYNLDGNR